MKKGMSATETVALELLMSMNVGSAHAISTHHVRRVQSQEHFVLFVIGKRQKTEYIKYILP